MKKGALLLIAGILFTLGRAGAQISSGGTPASISSSNELASQQYIQQVSVPMPDINKLRSADKVHGKNRIDPAHIGVVATADIDFANTGTITELTDGSKVWRLQVNMPDAKA